MSELRYKTIIGRERALIDGLTNALQRMVGGPPPSAKHIMELRRSNSSCPVPTDSGATFEVQIVGPDGEITGHIARVTVELDRFESTSHE